MTLHLLSLSVSPTTPPIPGPRGALYLIPGDGWPWPRLPGSPGGDPRLPRAVAPGPEGDIRWSGLKAEVREV